MRKFISQTSTLVTNTVVIFNIAFGVVDTSAVIERLVFDLLI